MPNMMKLAIATVRLRSASGQVGPFFELGVGRHECRSGSS